MKKLIAALILGILLLSTLTIIVLSVQFSKANFAPGETTLFSDDFESYTNGTFPTSGGWNLVFNGMGNQYQFVTNAYYVSASKSLQLWGMPDWSAVAERGFNSSSRFIGYEVSMMISANGTGGPGRIEYVGFYNSTIGPWGKWWATVVFDHDTLNILANGTVIGTWTTGSWYIVRVVLDRNTSTYSVAINGQWEGNTFKTDTDSYSVASMALQSDHVGVKVYFDDVRVFSTDHLDDLSSATKPLCLVVRGLDNGIYYRFLNATTSTWSAWEKLPGATPDSPAVAYLGGKVFVVVRGMDGSTLWQGSIDVAKDTFSGWTMLDGATSSAPGLASSGTP